MSTREKISDLRLIELPMKYNQQILRHSAILYEEILLL